MHAPLNLRTLELFAGGGGAALGLRDAGFQAAVVVERDPSAVATLRGAGFSVLPADIDPSGESLLGALPPDWAESRLFGTVWSSPPCQPFSQPGARGGASDARDRWPATLRIVQALRPQVFIGENVGSFARHDRDCTGTGTAMDCSGCAFDQVTRTVAELFPYSGCGPSTRPTSACPSTAPGCSSGGPRFPCRRPCPRMVRQPVDRGGPCAMPSGPRCWRPSACTTPSTAPPAAPAANPSAWIAPRPP